ncbi:glyoxalase superfamily protein [Paenibacillus oryzisoli]|uniref:Bleomycin resistance protein n=1 Tax=Paenibacillus oryzisoli TaxID=1850517 RepID=A0A198AJ92_9BACL|nr:glyoxalase superfamily protein [Paenibacillus oryzisoli]OAS21121.1 hypothetical protein A8708_29975 [Paenibacillus oryzisoli]
MSGATPIFRMFDEAKAREFYFDYLGFTLAWEHRFEPDMPLYMEITLDTLTIHLSEHHGDCSPGAAIRVEMADIEAFHSQLAAYKSKYSRPGIHKTPWDTQEVTVTDPFGNRIIFFERLAL